jgi:hypothetical protein
MKIQFYEEANQKSAKELQSKARYASPSDEEKKSSMGQSRPPNYAMSTYNIKLINRHLPGLLKLWFEYFEVERPSRESEDFVRG